MSSEPDNTTLFEAETILGKGLITIQEWPAGGEVIIYMDGELVGSVDSSEFYQTFEVRS